MTPDSYWCPELAAVAVRGLSLWPNSRTSDMRSRSIGAVLRYDTLVCDSNLGHALNVYSRHCEAAPNGRGELTSVDNPIGQREVRRRWAAASHAVDGFFEFGEEGTEAVLRNTSFCRIIPNIIVGNRGADHIRIALRPAFAIGGQCIEPFNHARRTTDRDGSCRECLHGVSPRRRRCERGQLRLEQTMSAGRRKSRRSRSYRSRAWLFPLSDAPPSVARGRQGR